ncbi:MAG TPA: 1,3--beta-D-glucan 3-glucanohydrolase, partial [Leeuwenhoekiella sp.]|nr:1,3--beta-D-glucan 3-glucanohydrolase [Leeuwenhoekiella sp.]
MSSKPQRWNIDATEDGFFEIRSQVSGFVLDVDGCLPVDGQNVQQWETNGADCQ